MSKRTTIILVILLVINVGFSLWNIYNQRRVQARICEAIGAINDQVMTKLNGTIYDKETARIFNNCIGNSFFLVPGFSSSDIDRMLEKEIPTQAQ